MALVPFRTLGPAADQRAQERLFQVGGFAITIRQNPRAGLAPLEASAASSQPLHHVELERNSPADNAVGQRTPQHPASNEQPQQGTATPSLCLPNPTPEHRLGHVGLVAWQCGFLLADFLLHHSPLGSWAGVSCVDVGCGTGLVGIALALAGARVTLTDLPHVTPLTELNVQTNCERHQVTWRPQVKDHAWGDAESASALLPQPDLITAADVLYDKQYYDALLTTLELLCAPHTLVFIGWKKRHADEEDFLTAAALRGFAVEQVAAELLSEEYREEGSYAILRLSRLEPMECE